MALNVLVSSLLTQLKAACGYRLDVTSDNTTLIQELNDKQKWLAGEMDFAFLEDRWDVAVPIGSRYITFPTADTAGTTVSINYQRPIKLEWFYSNIWIPVYYGIDSAEYNYINSDQGRTQDPVQKWRWIQPAGQFEIWPMNATASTLRFTAQRSVRELALTTDIADLDDSFLVLSVAVDRLSRSKQADAPNRLSQAQDRLRAIRSAYPSRERTMVFGQGPMQGDRPRRRLQAIAVAGNG